jgi:hypothetical protein
MMRWRHLSAASDIVSLACRCVSPDAYREVAASLGVAAPVIDAPAMTLSSGQFTISIPESGKATKPSLARAN